MRIRNTDTIGQLLIELSPRELGRLSLVLDAAANSGDTDAAPMADAINQWIDAGDDDNNGCEGHESLRGDAMGVAVYCDGSCRAAEIAGAL